MPERSIPSREHSPDSEFNLHTRTRRPVTNHISGFIPDRAASATY